MAEQHRHHKQFHGAPESLDSTRRLALLEAPRVVGLCLDGIAAASVLDVGTGSGVFARAFADEGLRVAGIDLSPRMLTYARQQAPHIPFILARMEELPFRANAFDLVFLSHVLHETDTLTHTLGELRRCARQRVAALEWPYIYESAGPPLAHRLSPGQAQQAGREAGFRRIEVIPLQRMVLYVLDE